MYLPDMFFDYMHCSTAASLTLHLALCSFLVELLLVPSFFAHSGCYLVVLLCQFSLLLSDSLLSIQLSCPLRA
jgi:hypothetical protein